MRDSVIDGKFEHLRIDHDQAAQFRRHAVEQRQDHGVEADGLARTGGAGDQQVRHLGEIGHHWLAADGLAERQRQRRAGLLEIGAGQKLAQIDGFAVLVRQFDADHIAARNGRDTRGDGAHRARHVVGERDHAARFHPRRRFEFIERHHRAGAHRLDAAAHAEIRQHRFEHARIFFQRFVGDVRIVRHAHRLGEQAQRGQLIFAVREIERRLFGGLERNRLLQFLALHAHRRFAIGDAGIDAGCRRDRLGPDLQLIAVVFVLVFVIIVIVVVIAVVMIVGLRAAVAQFLHRAHRGAMRPQEEGGNVGDAAHETEEVDARRQEGERQSRQQQQQRQRRGQPMRAVEMRRVVGKPGDGQPDQAARAGRRQGCGTVHKAQPAGDKERAQKPCERAPQRVGQMFARHRAHAPEGGRGEEGERGDAEGLQQKIGRRRAEAAQKIGRRRAGRVVDAAVGGIVGRQRDQRRDGSQEQKQPRAAQRHHRKRAAQFHPRIRHGVREGRLARPWLIHAHRPP